ncbi:uncharacterized protein si:dkey-103g5.4 [Fundulus heteroclitus]|uniref:uncharacterized protein si:dkey-103g5.4 n=1 Tax=Fundulus heteroclitus TaxID=8078 RepID=UPI00165C0136|nr:uncharacterized protein si:dkey-103g5.4 [Fundulus heteroclitus]
MQLCRCMRFGWLFAAVLSAMATERNSSQSNKGSLHCQPGFYCPPASFSPLPCPKGTYGPAVGAVSEESCLKCPPHHYCPRPGLPSPSACGPGALQPLPGQDVCICPGKGQRFQSTDGRCLCTIGYQPTSDGEMCVEHLYSVCRDGKSRTQYGDCLDQLQWSRHCKDEVCQNAEDYRGYDRELGLCVCREPPGRAACGGLCRRKPATHLKLQCRYDQHLTLTWSYGSQVSSVSGRVPETIFARWDSHGALQCNNHHKSSHPVYIVQTTEAGFFGLLSGLPEEIQRLFSDTTQSSADDDYEVLDEVSGVENISDGKGEVHFRQWKQDLIDIEGQSLSRRSGVLNPTTCLHLGDILLFTINARHYPLYDVENLYNTNSNFDWGTFRLLEEQLTLSWTPPTFFSVVFSHPGVYVFTLSSNQHKHMYVRVMPAGGQCYEAGPFFPTIPRHLTQMGISRRRDLLLRPDWLVTGGLLFGAVVLLCLCVAVLIMFQEYGWPEKKPIKARYRSMQLAFQMDDYASKGSRVFTMRKTHRNQQARLMKDSVQPGCLDDSNEFWDYEHQVDLEAFSSNTFYSLLLKQNLSVTTRLGKLTTEVKEMYQGVLGKLQLLHPPGMIAEERAGEAYERMRKEMEKEVGRRRSLASQLRTLLDNQMEVLRREQQAKQRVYGMFSSWLRECTRLLSKLSNGNRSSCDLQQQIWTQKLTTLVDEMGELVATECHRQGAWGLLGEGTGAKLLCPDTGAVLTKEDFFGPDGSLRVPAAVHCDPVTGLIRPNAHSHMLLSSGHTMAVPPDYFLHPQTGRVLPIVGNVSYDPVSSTLVPATDLCTGDTRKWDSPLLPFLPYPTSCHSEQPQPGIRLKGLKPGQRLQLGMPMADPDTGVPVPTLAVTIHPQTGLVYPLGGLHICPLSRLLQPIQIGYPMLDSRTGNIVLTVGVSLDRVTGDVQPVGGALLGEVFTEPLSGRMVRVGGATMRAGQLAPHAGGYQTVLDSKVLSEMHKTLDLLKPLTDEWGSDPTLQTMQSHPGNENMTGRLDDLLTASKELEQAWGRSLHCGLQVWTRFEMLLDWALGLQEDGGILGEMPLPDSDVSLPALLGKEYPDPMGSGLSVPVLGSQRDPVSGNAIPLAGTMEDPKGKGLVAIRYGAQAVDPVTGLLAPVVGARLDLSRKNIVPVTSSFWLMMAEQTDGVQVEALQREMCVRNTFWQQQRQREEDVLADLDSALLQHLHRVTDVDSHQVQWSAKQLKEAAIEMQDAALTEVQRKAAQRSSLALVLPPHVLDILTCGDEEEWDQQCAWHSTLTSGLDKLDVCMDQLQQDNEKRTSQSGEWSTNLHVMDRELRYREMWEQCLSTQTEVDSALTLLHFVRHLSQLRANTAQAVLCGHFWFKNYGLVQCSEYKPNITMTALLQQRAVPLLERLNLILEEKTPRSLSSNICKQHISENSTQSLRESADAAQSQDAILQARQQTSSSGVPSQEEQWKRLVEVSPLFQLLRELELRLKAWAGKAGFLGQELNDKGNSFVDVLDAQWECEGELIPLDPSVLNPREFLVYQHGLFLIDKLHNLKLTPAVSLQIAASLPKNNYVNNAFRNSFFYQEAEETLFVRRQRLQCVGGFSLMLLHCLSHIKTKDMSSDFNPAFQRLFFKNLQDCLQDFFQVRLSIPSGQESSLWVGFQEQGDLKEVLSDPHAVSLLHRLHKPSRGLLSEDEVEKMQMKHREESLLSHLEGLLRERSSEAKKGLEDQTG